MKFISCDVGCGSGDVAGVVESVTAQGRSDTLFSLLVRFVIADFFAVSNLSVRHDVGECDKNACISSPASGMTPWRLSRI
jgi:hypothetical protein